ncbi:hypothetical protein [Mesorhizobium sp. 131-2-1]|nr:hypothetical protein [Mesorhizobium sp. 131-2-1]
MAAAICHDGTGKDDRLRRVDFKSLPPGRDSKAAVAIDPVTI